MCEFCSCNSEGVYGNDYILTEGDVDVWIFRDKLFVEYFPDINDTDYSERWKQDIKYCPMCGRKLN